jgi:hypothetical protein
MASSVLDQCVVEDRPVLVFTGGAVQAEVGVTARVATATSGPGVSRPATIRSMIAQPA